MIFFSGAQVREAVSPERALEAVRDAFVAYARGEARAVARMAAARGWRSVLVVTSTYHVTRARLLFDRCVAAHVWVTGSTYRRSLIPLEIFLEPAKLAYALVVARSC